MYVHTFIGELFTIQGRSVFEIFNTEFKCKKFTGIEGGLPHF